MKSRFNLSLAHEDKAYLLKLRSMLETEEKSISLAEALRQAIRIAYKYQDGISKLAAK